MGDARAPAGPKRDKDGLRVSDAERDEAISQLRERFAEGRLTHDTLIHRVEAALRPPRSRSTAG